jgi:hypothetical protein
MLNINLNLWDIRVIMKLRGLNITQHWVWILPVLLIVFGLATHQIARFPISIDELLSMNNAGYIDGDTAISSILNNLETNSAQHMPAYFLLLGTLSQIFGWIPPALRMIGVWFGLLALAGVYRIGKDHHSGRAGLYATLFMAGLTLFSFYYAHIRMYSMLAMTTAFLIWNYLRLTQSNRPPHLHNWFLLSFSTLLFLSTHIFSITLMATIGFYHLFFMPKTRRWFQVSGTIILGGLPLFAWLPVLLKGFEHTSNFSIVTTYALLPHEILLNMLNVYSNTIPPLLVAWLGVALYLSIKQEKRLRLWLILCGVTTGVIMLIGGISPIIPPDRMRYTFVILIPLSLAFGMVIAHFRYHVLIAGGVLLIWFGADLWMHRTYDMSQYLGGRMNIYDMPRIDELVPSIQAATDSDTLILSFSNHHDLTLAVRHGNTVQDFYYESIQRQHYSIYLHQEVLKSDAEIQQGLSDALVGWSKLAWISEERHQPSKQFRALYDEILSESYQACEAIPLTSRVTLTYYVLKDALCDG